MKFVIIDRETDEILMRYEDSAKKKFGGKHGDSSRVLHIEVDDILDLDCIKYITVPEVIEHWTKDGEVDVFELPLLTAELWTKEGEVDVLIQPTLSAELWTKEDEDPVSVDPQDETWTYHEIGANNPTWTYYDVGSIDPRWIHVPPVAEHKIIAEDQALIDSKVQKDRDAKLARLREIRNKEKLPEFDVLVNNFALGDTTYTQQQLLDHQTALKDITETYRTGASGDDFKKGTSALDAIDPESFAWPTIGS